MAFFRPLIAVAALTCTLSANAVIFGENDYETVVGSSNSQAHELSPSVAMMIKTKNLNKALNGEKLPILGDFVLNVFYNHGNSKREICDTTMFVEEVAIGTCSGVLVAEDIVATAGHCLAEGQDKFKWVFNYHDPESINEDDVYSVKEIIQNDFAPIGLKYSEERRLINEQRKRMGMQPLPADLQDYSVYRDIALVRLDRKVKGAPIAKIAASRPEKGTPIVMLGHPIGLTQKVTSGGNIVNWEETNYASTNTDLVKGNSGSPVFNEETGELIGIMVNQGFKQAYRLDRKRRCYDFLPYDENETQAKYLSGFISIDEITGNL